MKILTEWKKRKNMAKILETVNNVTEDQYGRLMDIQERIQKADEERKAFYQLEGN